MTRPLAALAVGGVIGLAASVVFGWALCKGCPVFDVEHDSNRRLLILFEK